MPAALLPDKKYDSGMSGVRALDLTPAPAQEHRIRLPRHCTGLSTTSTRALVELRIDTPCPREVTAQLHSPSVQQTVTVCHRAGKRGERLQMGIF